MAQLLSEAFTVALQSDRAVALAAAFVIGSCHADVLQFVSRTIFGEEPAPEPRRRRKRRKAKSNGAARKAHGAASNGEGRRAQRDADDEALVAAMKENPAGPISAWAEAISKSRTSTIAGLKRLRDAGLATNESGVWSLAEEPPPREPAPRWVEPPRVRSHREHVTV